MDNIEHWGIYNTMQKKFQFGIDEPSKKIAKRVMEKIRRKDR